MQCGISFHEVKVEGEALAEMGASSTTVPSSSHQSLVAMHACTPCPRGGWVTTRPWHVSVAGALLQVISGYITCLFEPHPPQSGMTPQTPLCFVDG